MTKWKELAAVLIGGPVAAAAIIGAGVILIPQPQPAPAASVAVQTTASDPQALLDEGLAYEARWRAYKAGKGDRDHPPPPFEFDRIDRALGDLPQSWEKANDAIELIRRMRAERPQIEKAYEAAYAARNAKEKAAREKALLEKRRKIANLIERVYLEAGQDLYASAEGPELRTLRLKYVLIGRPFVYKVQNDAALRGRWLDMGFRKVIMTDGYGKTWTLKLD